MKEEDARAELARLAAEIAKHDSAYHQQDAPLISDAAYDKLKQQNAALEAQFPQLARPDSPSQRVGGPVTSGFGKITHGLAMLSLGNAFSAQDTLEFVARIRRFLSLGEEAPLQFTAEPKIDDKDAKSVCDVNIR